MFKVGDSFYEFGDQFFHHGFEVRKHWVSQVDGRGYRHIGGAVDSPHDGHGLPYNAGHTPREAFRVGKRNRLESLAKKKRQLHEEIRKVMREEEKLRATRFENVRIYGDNETFAQFMRNWELDF